MIFVKRKYSPQSNIKTPVSLPASSTSVHISGNNPMTNIPPGFSIPSNYATNSAGAAAPPPATFTSQEPTDLSSAPIIPSALPQVPSSITQLDPVSAGATTTTTSTTHLFPGQTEISFTQSKIDTHDLQIIRILITFTLIQVLRNNQPPSTTGPRIFRVCHWAHPRFRISEIWISARLRGSLNFQRRYQIIICPSE